MRTVPIGTILRSSLFVLVASCGDSSTPAPITSTVGAMGASIDVSAAGDPMLAHTSLIIPAGALSKDTVITVSRGVEQASSSETGLGPSVRFSPDGLVFATPALLTLPYKPSALAAGQRVAVAVTSAGQKSELTGASVLVSPDAQTVTVNISHFTDYEAVSIPAPVGGGDGGTDGGVDAGPPPTDLGAHG